MHDEGRDLRDGVGAELCQVGILEGREEGMGWWAVLSKRKLLVALLWEGVNNNWLPTIYCYP